MQYLALISKINKYMSIWLTINHILRVRHLDGKCSKSLYMSYLSIMQQHWCSDFHTQSVLVTSFYWLADLSQCNKRLLEMDFISILHYQWNFPPQVYAAETTFDKSFLCTQYSKIIPTKMSYMYISFKMIFLQKIISQSPESGSPQVSLNSNFLGRVTTITQNY